ncbi:helix-turn-helix domain-containing protein [Saccharicrinis aurantiacus]|uniref:helix-turn-helix domain-containing protein n=1 Tax=Saccharicrinis aurantiacus TaxID=1849719 RepID=UPI00094FC02E|nr:helix-turn-helix domain-containing protein [Saccharicrinis aurantiacus]
MNQNTASLTDILSQFINTTNQHIFLTGKAGTGKTTFLRNIAKTTHKNIVIAAPTGIAAINAGGVTLHSLFQMPFGAFIPDNEGLNSIPLNSVAINSPRTLLKGFHMHKNKRSVLQKMELLVIDEVSMLRADLLDAIDLLLRTVRRERNIAFGGVQVLFIGDLLQLPPVIKDEEWRHLSIYYKGVHFFNAQVLQQAPLLYIELDKIYRQSDAQFINLLNNLRDNIITNNDIELLNQFYKPNYQQTSDDGVILLTTHNRIADEKNSTTLAKIEQPEQTFRATVTDDFKDYNYPAEENLKLKVGAQVMFIKNDYSGDQLYFNGKIGHVESFLENEITVSFTDGSESATVEPYTWENKKYVLNKNSNEVEESVAGTFTQYPLKLAWAITVHKSQGLTFDKAIIDVGNAFAPGQIYVALSRLRDIKGLILTSKLPSQGIPIDNSLKEFSKLKKQKEELMPALKEASNLYLQSYALFAYDFNSLMQELRNHLSSYNKDKNRSVKQQHKEWASNLVNASQGIKDVADSFRAQIYKITNSKEDGYLSILNERIEKSIAYFEPLVKNLHDQVRTKMGELTKAKGVKAYQTELVDISNLYYGQLQRIYKVKALIDATLEGTDVSKDSIKNPEFSETREIVESKKKTRTAKEKKDPKTPKIPTHQISYDLYKSGKTVEEIAKERSFVTMTIEGHLAKYVQTGDLDVKDFVAPEKIAPIEKEIHKLDDFALNPIKEALGSNYSYGEIKMVIAWMKSQIEGEE